MPGFSSQFGSQPVAEWLESRRQHLPDIFRRQHLIEFASFMTVDAGAECVGGDEAIQRVTRLEPDNYSCRLDVWLRAVLRRE